MIGFLFTLTLRSLALRKTTLLLLGLNALPVLLALVYRLSDSSMDPGEWVAKVLYIGFLVSAVLPLTALMLGVSVLGDEFEDGTAVYLLTKPVPRWQILAPKIAASWALTAALVVPSTLISGLIAIQDDPNSSVVWAFTVAVLVATLLYCCIFVMLSLVSNRALIVGLIYVFLWEGAITTLFEGVRYLSVRHTTLGLAEWLAGVPPGVFDAYVGGATAVILMAVALVTTIVIANNKLEQIEVREST